MSRTHWALVVCGVLVALGLWRLRSPTSRDSLRPKAWQVTAADGQGPVAPTLPPGQPRASSVSSGPYDNPNAPDHHLPPVQRTIPDRTRNPSAPVWPTDSASIQAAMQAADVADCVADDQRRSVTLQLTTLPMDGVDRIVHAEGEGVDLRCLLDALAPLQFAKSDGESNFSVPVRIDR